MPLSKTRSESQSLTNIGLFQIGEIGQQLLDSASRGQRLHNHAYGHAHSTDTWFATHELWILRDTVKLRHVVIIAQN